MNYNGVLIEINGSRAKVRIETMGVQLSANFDKNNLDNNVNNYQEDIEAGKKNFLTVDEFVKGTSNWRTDLYLSLIHI